MKKLYTLKDLKKKYDPDKVIAQIEENFVLHKYTLINLLSIDSCPLSNYKQERQLSFLETKGQDDAELIKEIAEMLRDAIYFMTLSKKERTNVTQKMRSFASELVDAQVIRINLFIDDPLLVLPYSSNKNSNQPEILNEITEVLRCLESGLKIEQDYWANIPRAGYLSGLQVSMGEFFMRMNQMGMSQKDQITMVQQIFYDFKVDWEEGARENIKVSLQQPALDIFHKRKMHFDSIIGINNATTLSTNYVSELTSAFNVYKSELRRF